MSNRKRINEEVLTYFQSNVFNGYNYTDQNGVYQSVQIMDLCNEIRRQRLLIQELVDKVLLGDQPS